jgi:putative transposase
VIRFHPATLLTNRWIGVDLNTTGHVAVAADPDSGKVMKLGKNIHYVHSHSLKNCTKLFREGKLWKLKKFKSRERKKFKSALHAICRQIVFFAESLGSGIKFERLFSPRYSHPKDRSDPFVFSFENGSFFVLQRSVEKQAHERGIPVMYVNPAYTSKRCSRCGRFGRRMRKRFECPHCGFVAHADVNAAFNIAAASLRHAVPDSTSEKETDTHRLSKKEMRKLVRVLPGPDLIMPDLTSKPMENNLLVVLE